MSATACEDFYRRSDEVSEKISNSIREADWAECQLAPPNRINFGRPLVLADSTARDWLLTNYSLAANFSQRMPPAMGEVCAFLSDSAREGENGVIIPKVCLEYVQGVFLSLRSAETAFNGTNGNSLYRHMAEIERGFKVSEMGKKLCEESQRDSDLLTRSEIWELRTPLPLVQNYFDERSTGNGGIYRTSGHTHVGNVDWTDAILTGSDLETIAYQDENVNKITKYREDVMHLPVSVLFKLQEGLEREGAANVNGGAARILERGGHLDETLETDLLGISFTWNLQRRKLGVRPIVSESHYAGARGNVPEGERMNIKGCYIDVNTDYPDFSDHTPVLVEARSFMKHYAI